MTALALRQRRHGFPYMAWVAAWLADAYHLRWYAFRCGNINPLAAWRHFQQDPAIAPEKNLVFHRYATIAGLWLLGRRFRYLRELAPGLAFHRLLIGHPKHPYHLEFIHHEGTMVGKAPTKDNLLVFYIPDHPWKINEMRSNHLPTSFQMYYSLNVAGFCYIRG